MKKLNAKRVVINAVLGVLVIIPVVIMFLIVKDSSISFGFNGNYGSTVCCCRCCHEI